MPDAKEVAKCEAVFAPTDIPQLRIVLDKSPAERASVAMVTQKLKEFRSVQRSPRQSFIAQTTPVQVPSGSTVAAGPRRELPHHRPGVMSTHTDGSQWST
eukprot:Blabericola_migrator_1__5355@NODE_2745_length_2398_cov_7_032175_g1719_i0_p2_GENE_NODE_2745_length_2398_cov_7_032175_g1719_i0NODE_2745_length_2398_cov_7_032175_g1719_i0_p2_ORF_typecomplete_len100_score12_52_NODE_2745_length_2398_cov_7_032175_g1719_i013641663